MSYSCICTQCGSEATGDGCQECDIREREDAVAEELASRPKCTRCEVAPEDEEQDGLCSSCREFLLDREEQPIDRRDWRPEW